MRKWYTCKSGLGINVSDDEAVTLDERAAGTIEEDPDELEPSSMVSFWIIGKDESYLVPFGNLEEIDILRTGDAHPSKICNVCHLQKDSKEFSINQTRASGSKTRRPSCDDCRVYIDGKRMSLSQRRGMESSKPKKGDPYQCPICKKRSIAFITANITLDHDHATGAPRGWICDSCNTGLGRFKNGRSYLEDAILYLHDYDDQ